MDENYSYDYGSDDRTVTATLDNENATLNCDFAAEKHKTATLECDFENDEELEIIRLIKEDPSITQSELHKKNWHFIRNNKKNYTQITKKGHACQRRR